MQRLPLDALKYAQTLEARGGIALFHPTPCLTASAGSGAGPRVLVSAASGRRSFQIRHNLRQDAHLFLLGATMQIYYSSLSAIEQQTMHLYEVACRHCQKIGQLISHGFIHKKQVGADPVPIGKRVYCSNRHKHTGCGRTIQLYLDQTVRYLHYTGAAVVAFVLSLIAGAPIQHAYQDATGTATPRNAYRWLNRLCGQLSTYRSLAHQPPLANPTATTLAMVNLVIRPPRMQLLLPTFGSLLARFGQPLCAVYQSALQQSLL